VSINLSASRLSNLIGLEGIKNAVRQLSSPDNYTHAVLLYGGEGCGKTTVAQILARSWICLSPVDGEGCGTCKPCLAFAKGFNSDLLLVEPQPPANWIRLNQVVEVGRANEGPHVPICTFLRTPPLSSRHKVVLIENADRMNLDAANALLKTLEEPSPFVKLVLTTTEVSRILATIRSRCMALACAFPELSEMPSDLDERSLAMAGGSLGEIDRIKANPELFERLWGFSEHLPKRRLPEALVAAEEFRSICEKMAETANISARRAQTEALKILARYIIKVRPDRPDWTQAIVETHRRIQGNANVLPAFDSLFARILMNP
jgi:DNA polymerase-3 subunit delta'